jgi:hypothetical protein
VLSEVIHRLAISIVFVNWNDNIQLATDHADTAERMLVEASQNVWFRLSLA